MHNNCMNEDIEGLRRKGVDCYNQGVSLDSQGKTEEAIKMYYEALVLCPELAEAHYSLGFSLALSGKTEEAIRSWRRAIWLNPEYQCQLISALDIDHELRETTVHFQMAPMQQLKVA